MHGNQGDSCPTRLAELISRDGIKRSRVAAHCDVDQSTLFRWQKGAPIPDSQKVRLAELFDVSVPYLMGWDAPEPEEAAA